MYTITVTPQKLISRPIMDNTYFIDASVHSKQTPLI